MFKEALIDVLESDLQVYGQMIKGTESLLLGEQERLGLIPDSPYLRQLRRTLRGLEKQARETQHQLCQLLPMRLEPVGVGEN